MEEKQSVNTIQTKYIPNNEKMALSHKNKVRKNDNNMTNIKNNLKKISHILKFETIPIKTIKV